MATGFGALQGTAADSESADVAGNSVFVKRPRRFRHVHRTTSAARQGLYRACEANARERPQPGPQKKGLRLRPRVQKGKRSSDHGSS